MSLTDTMSILLVFAMTAIIGVTIVIRHSDYSNRVKITASRVLTTLSVLSALSSVTLFCSTDLDNVPRHTADGLVSTISLGQPPSPPSCFYCHPFQARTNNEGY